MKVTCCVMAGLGSRYSEGITKRLIGLLEEIEGVDTIVGSYSEAGDFANLIEEIPEDEGVVIVGHSLGANMATQVARWSGRRIDAIYGFDPADNPAASMSQYRMTPVPANVRLAKALVSTQPGLGGGKYEAENPGATVVKNVEVPDVHTATDDAIEDLLTIFEFIRRLSETEGEA